MSGIPQAVIPYTTEVRLQLLVLLAETRQRSDRQCRPLLSVKHITSQQLGYRTIGLVVVVFINISHKGLIHGFYGVMA